MTAEEEKELALSGWRFHCDMSDCYAPGDSARPASHANGVVSALSILQGLEVRLVRFSGLKEGETITRVYVRLPRQTKAP